MAMERENEESLLESLSETRPRGLHNEDAASRPLTQVNEETTTNDATRRGECSFVQKPLLSPAEQILVGTHQQPTTYSYPTAEADNFFAATNPYLLNSSDVGTLSRSMTALGLSNTIPEEPSDMDLDSSPLMNARRIASKSAIDLVGLNEAEIFDANASLGGELGGGGLSLNPGRMEQAVSKPLDHGFSFQVTSLPSRSIIVSNLSALLNDESIQMLFQMSGDVQSVRMEYRLQGIVQVTYYDIRCAVAAKEQLNSMAVAEQYLNVQFVTTPGSVGSFTEGTLLVFHIDPKLDAQQVTALFSKYGEVKRAIRIPDKEHHRLIEFYDLRHANAAMDALNSGESTQQSVKAPGFSPTRLKQTMSLQQIAGENVESEQDEDHESRSWDGSAQAVQQMETLMGLSDGRKQTNFIQQSNTGLSSALVDHQESSIVLEGLTKSVSIGSGLCDSRLTQDTCQETPKSRMNRAVQLTPELAEGLKLSDSASSLGSTAMFPGPGAPTPPGFNASPKVQTNSMGGYGMSGLLGGFHQRGMSNSSSVETGLDSYGHTTLNKPVLESGVPSFSAQPHSMPFQSGLGLGMGTGGGLGTGQGGYLHHRQPQMDAASLLNSQGGDNLVQAIAAAQASGLNIYDILGRIPNANLATISQLLAANRGVLGQAGTATANPSLLGGNMSSVNAARLLALQNLQSSGFSAGGLSSPSYGLGGVSTGSGLDLGNMSKSASSPALHVGSEDRDSSSHRFGGRLSRRNVDPLIEAERRAQQQRLYALDLDKIRRKEDKRTTLMIKNIPNKYTQKMLLASIDETLKGTYDFFYLPIDFKNKCNVGYGFINMREPEDIIPLVERFHNKKWERFNSEKICCVAYGRIQGKQALINHFQNSSLMHEDKKHRPVLFVTEGPNKGEPEPFPIGSNIRPKITLKERDFRSRERSGHWT